MRNLTIKREKSFAGSLTRAKVYVYDELVGDTKINGDICYKLGELKNGEEKNFVIGDEETKIYVIQDKLSKNMCNEVCYIPAGFENVYLMGECKYNPFAGNNFRFHGMTDPRVLANRKKTSKKFGAFLALCAVFGLFVGFFSTYDPIVYGKDGKPYEFVDESGVIITLTDTFEKMDTENTAFTYGTNDAVVFGHKAEFSASEGLENYTLEEYADASIQYNELDAEVKKENGITYYLYKMYVDNEGAEYYYFAALYKTEEAFWTITFAIDEAQYEVYEPLFFEWANSVEFFEE